MRKKREFPEGGVYHVTSRTNNKTRVFENRLGRKIMLLVLEDAKDKFRFRLANFCIMPTHIHLLIEPRQGKSLSTIMHWIKTRSAKSWNFIHGSTDHLWGQRFFARAIRGRDEYESIMNYIDQNPVKAELVSSPAEWKASGAYYKARNITGLVDFGPIDRQPHIKLLSPIPPIVSRLIPPAQLAHTLQHYGVYADAIDRLYALVPTIPGLGESAFLQNPPAFLHYFTGTADYYIREYDGKDTMYGLVRFTGLSTESEYRRFSLTALKNNEFMKLEF